MPIALIESLFVAVTATPLKPVRLVSWAVCGFVVRGSGAGSTPDGTRLCAVPVASAALSVMARPDTARSRVVARRICWAPKSAGADDDRVVGLAVGQAADRGASAGAVDHGVTGRDGGAELVRAG